MLFAHEKLDLKCECTVNSMGGGHYERLKLLRTLLSSQRYTIFYIHTIPTYKSQISTAKLDGVKMLESHAICRSLVTRHSGTLSLLA